MKISIRRGVFETNSSSSHSLTIKHSWKPDPNVDYKSKFRTEGNAILVDMSYAIPAEYPAWDEQCDVKEFKTPEQKLALAIRLCSGYGHETLNEMKNYNSGIEHADYCEFDDVLEVIKKYTGCDNIIIDGLDYRSDSGSFYPQDSSDAYIYPYKFDDDIIYLCDFLRRMGGITLEQMLLDDSVICVSSIEFH